MLCNFLVEIYTFPFGDLATQQPNNNKTKHTSPSKQASKRKQTHRHQQHRLALFTYTCCLNLGAAGAADQGSTHRQPLTRDHEPCSCGSTGNGPPENCCVSGVACCLCVLLLAVLLALVLYLQQVHPWHRYSLYPHPSLTHSLPFPPPFSLSVLKQEEQEESKQEQPRTGQLSGKAKEAASRSRCTQEKVRHKNKQKRTKTNQTAFVPSTLLALSSASSLV